MVHALLNNVVKKTSTTQSVTTRLLGRVNRIAGMKRRASSELYEYWNAVRRGAVAPMGSAFDPSAVRVAMQQGFYLDPSDPGASRLSWIGPDLARGLPAARRDAAFLDLWSAPAQRDALRLLDAALRPCPVVAGAWGYDCGGMSRVLEVLLLPLLPRLDSPASARVIGVFAGVDPETPMVSLDAVSTFRILDASSRPWRDGGFGARRLRDGWSTRYAELASRAQTELGARAVAATNGGELFAPGVIECSLRSAKHLTVIEGGKIADERRT
jgi:hypothetical protein